MTAILDTLLNDQDNADSKQIPILILSQTCNYILYCQKKIMNRFGFKIYENMQIIVFSNWRQFWTFWAYLLFMTAILDTLLHD